MGHAYPARRNRRVVAEHLETRVLFAIPSDPLFDTDGRFTNVNAPAAWDITTGSTEVVVAIIDTGIDLTHPDLVSNLYTNAAEVAGDGVDNDNNGYVDDVNGWDFFNNDNVPEDTNGHGTHVAGIVGAAGNNTIGTSGIMQTVKLLPMKVGNQNEISITGATAALNYLAEMKQLWIRTSGQRGANVVVANGSFGGFSFPYNQSFDRAIARAGDQDVLFVVASGNDATNNDPAQDFPSKYTLSLPNVIGVAATDRNDEPAEFTNFGAESVHVAAPGVDIESTWSRDVDNDGNGTPDGLLYNTISGTSMASPMVAGILGLAASANPRASAAQLKQALLDGVDVLPSLDRPHSLPTIVTTGGRVDAYRAVRNVLNQAVKTDVATQGNWKGHYGTQGYVIPGEVGTLAPAQVMVSGADVIVGRSAARRVEALESPSSAARVNTYYRAAQSMDVAVNMGDAVTRRVSLYFNDLAGGGGGRGGRAQVVEMFDVGTGALLNRQSVSDFGRGRGQYLTYEVTGRVLFRLSGTGGRDVVLNGVFVDPTTIGAHGFQGIDTSTQGNWRANYDAEGAYIVGYKDFSNTEITATTTGATPVTVAPSTARRSALALERESRRGVAAYLETPTTATVALSFTDGLPHQVTVYAADHNNRRRAQRIELLDANGGVLDQREISNFKDGVYLTWEVTGAAASIRFTRLQGPSAVLSAIFVDEQVGYSGHYIGQNTTTGGMWYGNYGLESAYLVGDRDATVDPVREFNLSQTGGTVRLIDATSRNRAAVQSYVDPDNRVAAQLETRDSMTITLPLGTQVNAQRVSFYAADYGRQRLQQRIEIYDANNNLIGQTDMVNFQNGAYATFDLNGDVTVKVINLANNAKRAVLSAVYFG